MRPHFFFRLALALALSGFVTAQITAFEGPFGGPGNVVVYPTPGSAGIRPPELQGIVLLPVDAAGRSSLTQFLPDQPRLENDLGLASRVVLPGGQGCLYRYRRALQFGAEFGYFLVRPDGRASFLASIPGTGANGLGDPVPHPVAFSSSGDGMLFATTVAAGGEVIDVELASGTVHVLSAALPPLGVLPQGLILLSDWGAVLTTSGPLRFLRGNDTLRPIALRTKTAAGSLGSNPGAAQIPLAYMGNGFAASADGTTVALIAGESPTKAHVFAFHSTGQPMCVNDAATVIADPGFGTSDGPTLALSPNGSRAAWKVVGASSECFSRRVSLQPTPIEYHVTGDQNFTDTLNDTGVIAFFDPDSVVMIVGEFNGAGGIERGDFYRATFPAGAGAPALSNLTNTSGDSVAPFDLKGDIETSDGIYQIPGKRGLIYFVPGSSGQGFVYRLDPVTGNIQTIRSAIDQLDFVETAGANFVLQVLHDSPARRELVRVPFDHALPPASLGFFRASETVSSHGGNAAGLFAGVLNVAGGQRMFQISVPSGATSLLPGSHPYGSTLGFGSDGAAAASVQDSTLSYFFSWGLGGGSALHGSGPIGSVVLPAN